MDPAVVEDRAQPVDLVPDAGAVVDHQAGEVLPLAPAHDGRREGVQPEALVPHDLGDGGDETRRTGSPAAVVREGEVVGVPGVAPTPRLGEGGEAEVEAEVEAVRREVRQRR